MAFFKFRKDSDERPAPTKVPESVEVMRQRARHRLIGSALLVLLGVVGFPLLFDNQPRPIAVDIAIEIPDRNQVKPLASASSAASAASAPASATVVASESEIEFIEPPTNPKASAPLASVPAPARLAAAPPVKVVASASAAPKAVAPVKANATPAAPVKTAAASSVSTASVKTAAVPPVAKPAEPARRSVDDGAKAQALLEGKEPAREPVKDVPKPAAVGRFVVQIGAFSDAGKAHEARLKLERSGLKTYTQVLPAKDGAEGKRIRVRIGPFASKAEADATVQKIKKLDLPAGIFEL